MGAVTVAVIREPFDGMRGFLLAEASLNALEHQIADHLPGDSTGGRCPGHHLAITGVERKSDTNVLAVPAGDLEAVRCPSQVRTDRDDLTVVRSSRRLAGVALQQKSVLRYQAVNAFVVPSGKSGAVTLSIERRPDPAVTVSRPIIRQRSDGRQDLPIFRLLVSP